MKDAFSKICKSSEICPSLRTDREIDKEEGFRAFFKGGPARVLRSSPQFGFTLLGACYLRRPL